MASRDSVLYDKVHVKKFLTDARDRVGRVVPIPFEHLTVAGEAAADTVNLCVLPAGVEVVGFELITNGLVTVGITLSVGDAGSAVRYMIATAAVAAEARGTLAFAGMRYRPAADTIVFATYGTAAPAVGQTFRGRFLVVPEA